MFDFKSQTAQVRSPFKHLFSSLIPSSNPVWVFILLSRWRALLYSKHMGGDMGRGIDHLFRLRDISGFVDNNKAENRSQVRKK